MSSKKLPITTGAVITFILSIVLLGLSLSEIILEQNVLHTFRNVKIQYPNSSLAENLWVSLNPDYIDPNPTIAISVAGAVGVISAISSIVWVSALWWGVGWMVLNTSAIVATILAVISTVVNVAVLTYTFVTEAAQVLPKQWSEYRNTQFTREFYLCSAFPAVVDNAEHYYGFRACDHAAVARFNLIALSVIGVILTALGTVQLKSLGLFEKRKPSAADVETRAVRQKKTENIVADIALGAYPQLGSHETSSPPSNTTRRYDVPRNEIRNYT